MPHEALRAATTRYPAIAEAFWRDCLLDAAVLMQWSVNVGRRNAKTRLSHLFCELAVRSGQDGETALAYALPVTQPQLADAAALTPVHVNRTLRTLNELVKVKDGKVLIHDWAQLAHIADFDAAYLTADTGFKQPQRLRGAA